MECVDDPDIPTCLWAIISSLSPAKLIKIGGKLPKISKAIWGINRFLDKVDEARKKLERYEDALERAWKKLPACVRKSVTTVSFVEGGAQSGGLRAAGGDDAGKLGDTREEYIAKLLGGKVAKDANGQDLKLVMPNVGSTGLGVLGPNGEFIFGGGSRAQSRGT
ncbi:hypothetical protein [Streptomyces sp. TLI_146]|uniref:hypothetical protein n=1 Tax=Streptomyces sp. TLI_146 TaxID=1938858 RepID=UPI000C70E076|nr:hypothetical protein [Streptomyces sp. TLI_146]PKV89911.1 hypothetical protein BX283_7558 [Streptomyces sp. TLI_146]